MPGKGGKEAKPQLSPELEDQVDNLHSQAQLARACLLSFPAPPPQEEGADGGLMTHWPRSHPPIPLPDLAQPSPLLYYRLMAIFSCVGGRGLGFLPQALLWAACSVIESPSRRQTACRGPRVTLFCFLRLLTCSRPVPGEWHDHLFVPSLESLSPACSYPLLRRLMREAMTNSILVRTGQGFIPSAQIPLFP